jgi:hypothetical protein
MDAFAYARSLHRWVCRYWGRLEFRWTAGARVLLPLEELLEVWLETYKGARASRTALKVAREGTHRTVCSSCT